MRTYAFVLAVPDLRRAVGYFEKALGFGRDWGDGTHWGAFARRRPDDDRPLSRCDASGANRRVIIFVLLYLNFGRLTETLIVMLSVPFALVGGVWLMDFMHFNMSVAVAVGFIALAGVAAETGVVMLIYLDHALTERRRLRGRQPTVRLLLGLWPAQDTEVVDSDLRRALGADFYVTSLREAVRTCLAEAYQAPRPQMRLVTAAQEASQ